jgi:hypothetical protein
MSMQFYSSGVISDCCEGLNHGVLAVGYDVSGDTPYWVRARHAAAFTSSMVNQPDP